ncbi:MAG: hypothetical protein K0Q70_1940 [Rhodospirillales bacterium]|nr:hypothetical protein [Rhodospirillales bacterium]
MDDYDNRFAPGYGTEFTRDFASHQTTPQDLPGLALQEVSPATAKASYLAISPGPPIADYRQKKKRRSPVHDSGLGEELAAMIVKGRA